MENLLCKRPREREREGERMCKSEEMIHWRNCYTFAYFWNVCRPKNLHNISNFLRTRWVLMAYVCDVMWCDVVDVVQYTVLCLCGTVQSSIHNRGQYFGSVMTHTIYPYIYANKYVCIRNVDAYIICIRQSLVYLTFFTRNRARESNI